jgi:hypothetical protein
MLGAGNQAFRHCMEFQRGRQRRKESGGRDSGEKTHGMVARVVVKRKVNREKLTFGLFTSRLRKANGRLRAAIETVAEAIRIAEIGNKRQRPRRAAGKTSAQALPNSGSLGNPR